MVVNTSISWPEPVPTLLSGGDVTEAEECSLRRGVATTVVLCGLSV